MRTFFLGVSFLAILLFLGVPLPDGNRREAFSSTSSFRTKEKFQEPNGTVDGAVTPDLIPDDVAYSMFFSFVSNRKKAEEKRSLSSYLQHYGLGDVDINVLTEVSDNFNRASEIIGQNHASLTVENINYQRAVLVHETTALLFSRIGVSAAEKVRYHVIENIKRKMKIIPGPTMPSVAHSSIH